MNDFVDSLLTRLLTDFPQQITLLSVTLAVKENSLFPTWEPPTLDRLPPELLEVIFSHLDQLGAVIQVCTKFKETYFNSIKLRTIHALAYAHHLGAADYFSVWFVDDDRFRGFLKNADTPGFRLGFKKIMIDVLDKGDPYDALKLAKLATRLGTDKTTQLKCFEVAKKSFLKMAQERRFHKPHLFLVDAVSLSQDIELVVNFIAEHAAIVDRYGGTYAMVADAFVALKKANHTPRSQYFYDLSMEALKILWENHHPELNACMQKMRELMVWQDAKAAQRLNENQPLSRESSNLGYQIVMRLASTGKIDDAIAYYYQIPLENLTVVKMQACFSIACALFEQGRLYDAKTFLEEAASIEKQFSMYELALTNYLDQLFKNKLYQAAGIFISICPADQLNKVWACCALNRAAHRLPANEIHEAIEKISDESQKELTLCKCIDQIEKNDKSTHRASYFYSLLTQKEGVSIPLLARFIALDFKLQKSNGHTQKVLEACTRIKNEGLMSTYPTESIDIAKYLFLSNHLETYRNFIEKLKKKNKEHAFFPDLLKHLCQEQARVGDKVGYTKTLQELETFCKKESGYYTLVLQVLGPGGKFSRVKEVSKKIPDRIPGNDIFQQTLHMRNYRSNWKKEEPLKPGNAWKP